MTYSARRRNEAVQRSHVLNPQSDDTIKMLIIKIVMSVGLTLTLMQLIIELPGSVTEWIQGVDMSPGFIIAGCAAALVYLSKT